MILPIGTDVRLRHRPWANWALIAANVLIFALTRVAFNVLTDMLYAAIDPRIRFS